MKEGSQNYSQAIKFFFYQQMHYRFASEKILKFILKFTLKLLLHVSVY